MTIKIYVSYLPFTESDGSLSKSSFYDRLAREMLQPSPQLMELLRVVKIISKAWEGGRHLPGTVEW